MGFIHNQQRVMRLLQLREPPHIGEIPVHAEHRFGHDDRPAIFMAMLREQFLKMRVIAMAIAKKSRP